MRCRLLGALLIYTGFKSIRPGDAISVWRSGWPSWVVGITTFLATLLLPIQAAVGLGVVLSPLIYVIRSSTDISMVQLVRSDDGRFEERTPPRDCRGDTVTVLDVYGPLFYAGARTFERILPRPNDAHRAVVVLRLRGNTEFRATLIEVLSNYAKELDAVGSRLYLSGMSQNAYRHIRESGKIEFTGPVRAYEMTPILGELTLQAVE